MQTLFTLFESRSRWWALFSLVLFLGTAWMLVSAADPGSVTSGQIPSPHEGFQAPDFTLKTLDGDEVRLSDLRGDPVVLNLWASWCPPCRTEMPAFNKIHQANAGRGLHVLAVNMTFQDSESDAIAFAEEFELEFPVLLDRTGSMGRSYQMRALPSTFLIDREGIIRRVIIGGPVPETTLVTEVEALFEGRR